MEELLEKEVPLIINIEKKFLFFRYRKKIYFEIEQANFKDLIEFDYYFRRDQVVIKYIYSLLKKHNKKFRRKDYYSLSINEFEKVLDFFLINYCRKFYNIWAEEKPAVSKESEKEEAQKIKKPFSATIAFILKNSNETYESLKKLTWEQIEYINSGIVWNINDSTKEWKLLNEKNAVNTDLEKWVYEDDLKAVKKQRKNVIGLLHTK